MNRRAEKGFSLLETLFAMAVILVGILGIFGLFQSGLANMRMASVKMLAALLASNFLEEVKAYGFNNLPTAGTVASMASSSSGRITDFPAPYEGTAAISNVSEDLNGDGANDYADKSGNSMLREIAITVRIPGAFKDMTFRTRISRP